MVKKIFKNVVISFIFINILFSMLLLTNLIPKNSIKNNIYETLEYFKGKENRYNLLTDIQSSKNDIIADSIIINIMYNDFNNDLIKETLLSKHYDDKTFSYSENLINSITNNIEKNEEYSRYWHGYMILYRPLFTFLNISQIKFFYLSIYIILSLLIVYKCIKEKIKEFGIAYIVSNVLTFFSCGFISLEYIPAILVSLIGCLIVLYCKKIDSKLFFILLGISVAFFDFLTIETLTLTLPLLCFIIKNKEFIKVKDFILLNINWIIGYCGTFLYKWVLATIICKQNLITSALEAGIHRAHGELEDHLIGLKLNIHTLFPFVNKTSNACFIFIILIIILSIIFFLFRKESFNKNQFIYILFIALIPYIRYLVLYKHSFEHYFFTYRAQLTSIICIILIFIYFIDFSIIKRRK